MTSSRFIAPAKFSVSSASRSRWRKCSPAAPGRQVPVAETVRGFKEILDGKHDDVAEQNFYMKGGIEEIKRQGVICDLTI